MDGARDGSASNRRSHVSWGNRLIRAMDHNRSNRRSDGSDSSRLRDGSEIMDPVIDQWAFEGAKDHIAIHWSGSNRRSEGSETTRKSEVTLTKNGEKKWNHDRASFFNSCKDCEKWRVMKLFFRMTRCLCDLGYSTTTILWRKLWISEGAMAWLSGAEAAR